MNVAIHVYRAMRHVVQAMDDVLPAKFEITREGTRSSRIARDVESGETTHSGSSSASACAIRAVNTRSRVPSRARIRSRL